MIPDSSWRCLQMDKVRFMMRGIAFVWLRLQALRIVAIHFSLLSPYVGRMRALQLASSFVTYRKWHAMEKMKLFREPCSGWPPICSSRVSTMVSYGISS